jgi:hypothetical protein
LDRSRRVLLVAFAGTLLAALILRLEQLGRDSFWYDETVSVYLASLPLGELIAHTARDIHPPLYYVLLHFWSVVAGQSEFSAAFFSVWWGVLLVASCTSFARWVGGDRVALLVAALVTLSPFNIWYSQETRMYTLGATLGLWMMMSTWQLLRGGRMKKRWMFFWVASATAALYTLYYLAFVLLWIAVIVVWWLRRSRAPRGDGRRWALLALAVVLLWSPWLPTAIRQALEPPVPAWREPVPLLTGLSETLSALALGQSMNHEVLWPLLLPLVLVVSLGLWLRWRQKRQTLALVLLAGALVVPVSFLLLSAYGGVTLYHVRYIFPYSPFFYLLLGLAFGGWLREAHTRTRLPGAALAAIILFSPLLTLTGESVQRLWNDGNHTPDDLRSGVRQIERQWRRGDALLLNAGYIYTALHPYFDDPVTWRGRLVNWRGPLAPGGLTVLQSGSIDGDPSLGWALEESDFYASTRAETLAALERVAGQASRLWHLRLYDTVTDPEGVIRAWLEENALLFEDQLLVGTSFARVQGWYFPPRPDEQPQRPLSIRFLAPEQGNETVWINLLGVDAPAEPVEGGSWVDLTIWLEGGKALDPTTRLSLGLFDTSPARRQWTVTDEQPFGPLLTLSNLPGLQRWTTRLRLPEGLPPGKYEALLKFYRPSDGAALRGAGERMITPEQLVLAVVEVLPTPRRDAPPEVGTRHEARFGPLHFYGHSIPPGPWEQGASIPIELVWRQVAPVDEGLRAFLTSDVLSADDGGVAKEYPPSQWRPGEVVRDIHYVTIAADAAPGAYPIYLRVSSGSTTVPWRHGIFQTGEVLQIGTLQIRDRARIFEPPTVATPLDVAFGESIELIGATLPAPVYHPGQEVPVTLNWHASARPTGRFKIFTHLVGPDGTLRAQRDLEPGDGMLPTNGWARGEFITTSNTIPLPPDAPFGTYELWVGMYDPITNVRVPPFGSNVNGDARYLMLGTIEVTAP